MSSVAVAWKGTTVDDLTVPVTALTFLRVREWERFSHLGRYLVLKCPFF